MPQIRPFHSPLNPFEIYKKFFSSSPISFFLDSPSYQAPDQCYSYLGANPFLELQLKKGKLYLSGEESGIFPASDLFRIIRRLLSAYGLPLTKKKAPFFTGGMIGYFAYESVSLFEKIKFRVKSGTKIPQVYFAFYRDLLVYDHKRGHYWVVGNPDVREQKTENRLTPVSRFPSSASRLIPQTSRQEFIKMVKKAKEYIQAGDIYQANLSQRFSFDYEGDPLAIYEKLREINPSPFASFLRTLDFSIVSSSPERLIRKTGNLCETRPIAGTRPIRPETRSSKPVVKSLLKNEKERAEHIMLVDLERNDLGRVCDFKSVRVNEMMVTERYSHVLHIVSKITGKLRKDKDGLDLIKAMFPGGTITGCPKIRCMEIIDELEKTARGLYTGSIGYMDFKGDLDFNIVIRTLVLQKNKGWLQVGAGIVHDSDPEKEYEETLHKGEALAEALAAASNLQHV